MDHTQPSTPIVSENSSSVRVTNGTAKQLLSRAIDMHLYWIRDRIKQGRLLVFCKTGTQNLANYPTKHHPTYHCQEIRPTYLKQTAKDLHNSQT